jgi:hypothetical protein
MTTSIRAEPGRRHRRSPARGSRLAGATLALAGFFLAGSLGASTPANRWDDVPCSADGPFVVVAEHHYTLAVRVRPLLFWIRHDDVGEARLTWTVARGGATRVELLIGSDPERAPMRINRWGYLGETTCDGSVAIVGIMTESDEQSVEDARASTTSGGRAGHAFKAIRSSAALGESHTSVTRMVVDDDFTYRDVELALRRVPRGEVKVRRLDAGESTSGFLGAVADLVRESVETFARTGQVDRHPRTTRSFVHGDRMYSLSLRSSVFAASLDAGPLRPRTLIESEFEVRNPATRKTTPFRITYGTDGPLAGVPVHLVYRPRWWFEAELQLAAPR